MKSLQLHHRIPFVRRPFLQRDQAIGERDALMAERDALLAEKERTAAESNEAGGETTSEWEIRQRPYGKSSRTESPGKVDDAELVSRIVAAYRATLAIMGAASGSDWERSFFEMKRDVHQALAAGNMVDVQRMLRDPEKTNLFYGYDNLCRNIGTEANGGSSGVEVYRDLLKLSEAIGARRFPHPQKPGVPGPYPQVENLLTLLDGAMRQRIDFPNPFAGEVGLATSRGVASYRTIQAIYQAWRISSILAANHRGRAVEIGAGLGRTAYYAWQFGVRDYTIIDLPLTAVAQAYFLGRTLGPNAICLFGEDRPGIRVMPPSAFLDATDRYDLVVNVDSLTEMTRRTARTYCAAIKARSEIFLSINHEANDFTTREVCSAAGMSRACRNIYWLRAGYVEEVFRTGSTTVA
jgi:hypothetical protein